MQSHIENKTTGLSRNKGGNTVGYLIVTLMFLALSLSSHAEIIDTPAESGYLARDVMDNNIMYAGDGADNTGHPQDPDASPAPFSGNLLTADEQTWLDNHPNLKLSGDVNWPPFEFIDGDGRYVGMVGSVIALIEARLNYKFVVERRDSWEGTLDGIKKREVDVISGLAKTPQREGYVNFSDPYFSFPIVLVIREGLQFVTDLRELEDERVGVVKGYASYDYLIINHPDLNLQFIDSVEEGLKALSDGELDVLVSNIPSISFLIKKHGISNVRLTSITPYVYDLRVGISKEHPELVSILNKAIASIPQQQLDEIYKEWLFKDAPVDVDYRIVRRIALVSFIVIAIFWYWNRKLSKEVAERIRSENALRKSQDQLKQATYEAEMLARKADEANRAKSIFLANMSHEIRTPMNAVVGYTELLSLSVKDKKQRGYLDSIRTGSKALMTLINDILDLSKVEAGKLQIEFRPIAIKPLFDELHKIFFARIESKNLAFSVELSHDLPDTMSLDETRLRQVLFNLVGNAIKFTHKGGITVKAWVSSWTSPTTVNLMISVKDTGIGIPYDQHELIFKAFEQREGQSTREYGGTGLGLAISKNLVEMMGGVLHLKSEPGFGSCFTMTLHDVEIVESENPLSGEEHLLAPAGRFDDSADHAEPATYKRKDESLPVSFDSHVRKQIRDQFLVQWESVNGSGDLAAVSSFSEALSNAACKVGLTGLESYATELKASAEAFDLDEMQRLLEVFPGKVSD